MSDLKNYADLTIKQDANTSGTLNVKTADTFNANIVTSSDGMYDIDGAFHTLDEKTVEYQQNIKNAYEGARYKYTGSFDADGLASINLTSLAPSGSTYFNTASIDKVDVQILVDTGGNLRYTNDLVSVELSASQNHLFLNLEALGAANKDFRILAINEVDFISINSGGSATIVLVISDYREEAILSGSLAVDAGDYFGASISINSAGDRIAVGTYYDERSGGASSSGLAYVFASSSAGWTEQAILSGSLAVDAYDYFGLSISINSAGDRIAVGVTNDERSGGASGSGLAYIFASSSAGWTEQAILSGSLAVDVSDYFGVSISINSAGDRIAVGAQNDERSGGASSSGLVYVFASSSAGWTEQAILSGSLAVDVSDLFGNSISINSAGDRIAVGVYNDELSGGAGQSGLAYVFASSSAGWTEQAILSGSLAVDASDYFGASISINSAGDRIAVGAQNDERSGGASGSGLAYVFASSSAGWTEQAILSGSLAVDASDYFGNSISINSAGDRIAVGAYNDELSGGAGQSGLAYVFSGSYA